MSLPAILGGKPKFNKKNKLSIIRPKIYEKESIISGMKRIMESGKLTDSYYVAQLEELASEKLKVKHAIAVSNCTIGLLLVLKALDLKGDLIVPSFTFLATINAILWNDLNPYYCDINPRSLTISTSAIEEALSSSTSAILAVYTYGIPPNISRLSELSKKYNLKLIFDSAHALGSKFQGHPAGKYGNAEVFSLSPSKPITAVEGGIVTTNDDELAYKVRTLKNYGHNGDYCAVINGLNARLSELHALVGVHNLKYLEKEIILRNRLAKIYQEFLSHIAGIKFPQIAEGDVSSYKDFTIIIEEEIFGLNRDILKIALSFENIETKCYFYPPCHRQMVFNPKGKNWQLPVTDNIAQRVLCLPFSSSLSSRQLLKVAEAIADIKRYAEKVKKLCLKNGHILPNTNY